MIKKRKKRRKNPTFHRSEINYSYQFSKIKGYIIRIVGYEDLRALSNLLSFLAIAKDRGNSKDLLWFKEHCDDCELGSEWCSCEGSRNVSGFSCEQCGQNRCICDFGIQTTSQLINITASIVKETLNSKEIRELSKDIRSMMEFTPKSDHNYDNYEYFYKLLKS